MKIIQVIPEFGYGGAETMVEALSRSLKGQGHTVIVISLYNTHTEHVERMYKDDIRVLFLNKKRGLIYLQYLSYLRYFAKKDRMWYTAICIL